MVDAGTWNGWWLAAAGARAPCRSRCVCSTHTRRAGRAGSGGRWPVTAGCGLRSCTERPGSGRARAGRRQEARAHPEQASSQEGSVGSTGRRAHPQLDQRQPRHDAGGMRPGDGGGEWRTAGSGGLRALGAGGGGAQGRCRAVAGRGANGSLGLEGFGLSR